MKNKSSFFAIITNIIIILPIVIFITNSTITSVDAANDCEVSIDSSWNVEEAVTMHNVDSGSNMPIFDESFGFSESKAPLKQDFAYEVVIENGGATAISMKLMAGYKYNFCITFSPTLDSNSTIAKGDVYLMTKSNWDSYKTEYNSREWEDMAQYIEEIPVEWRDMFTWVPFRDVHAYEGEKYKQFSVGIDSTGSSWTSIFGDESANDYYLVLDGWDNSRPNDFGSIGDDMNAEILVEVEERLSIPPFTAYLLIGSLPISCIVIPIILHIAYKNGAKKDNKDSIPEQIPFLE